VPTPNVSAVDLVARLEKPASKEAVNDAFRRVAEGALKGILLASDEPLVSIDFNGNRHSAIVDLPSTFVSGDLVKVIAWYDNESGYAQRLFDLARYVIERWS
jgi:glyceraldehyde 3-phosphate dehydrogenase